MIDRLQQTPSEILPVGEGIPYYSERVSGDSERGLGGVYAGWGRKVTNEELAGYVGRFLGRELESHEVLELDSKGFESRYLTLHLSHEEQALAEMAVGEKVVQGAIEANGWTPSEVSALVVGTTTPLFTEYTVEIARRVGIPDSALKVSAHTACDSAMKGLHWVFKNEELRGKKVLVGGIENLSLGLSGGGIFPPTKDTQALQLFANGAAVFGVVPGVSFEAIVSREGDENMYDKDGALQVAVTYPLPENAILEERHLATNHIVIAGKMPPPVDGTSVKMADNRGMLELFGHTTADLVASVVLETQDKLGLEGDPNAWFDWIVMHHANYKIAVSQSRRLAREHKLPLDLTRHFVVNDFGNVSAASSAISFLRQSEKMKSGTRGLFIGYGAGGHYDVIAAEVP